MKSENRSGFRAKNVFSELAALLRSVPPVVIVLFILTVIAMNFLARITLVSLPWLALNAGICVSWLAFLLMDVVVKHFGARAANMLSIVAISANLVCCLLCFVISRLWAAPSLDMILGGQWSVLLASTIAYVASAVFNNYTNVLIGGLFRKNPDGRAAYAARTYVSTLLSQIVDNFLFIFLAFIVFPMIPSALQVRWTLPQCIGCSLTCAVLELLTEVVFSPIGYSVARKWKEKGVGQAYLDAYGADGRRRAKA